MRGYVMVGSSNLNESKAFYDVVLAVMGIVSIYEDEVCVGYAREGKQDVEFYITKPANGKPVTFGNGTQISFLTESKEQVDKFHKTALGLGAQNEGDPVLDQATVMFIMLTSETLMVTKFAHIQV